MAPHVVTKEVGTQTMILIKIDSFMQLVDVSQNGEDVDIDINFWGNEGAVEMEMDMEMETMVEGNVTMMEEG